MARPIALRRRMLSEDLRHLRRAMRIGVLGTLIAPILIGCASAGDTRERTAPETPSTEASSARETTQSEWTAVRAIDGDTIVVSIRGNESRVRVIGINTPETGECGAAAATDRITELVVGAPVALVADSSDTDQFERLLRYVETADGTDVGAVLVEEGLAIARRYEPDVKRADLYDELQEDARAANRGLWASDACGDLGAAQGAVEIGVRPDAPGNDNDNLNGEWVEITNVSDESISLDGWVLADESASHRYTFPSLVLQPGATVTVFSGCGKDGAEQLFWCSEGSAIWNNSGDTVFVRDRSENLVASHTYSGDE